MTNKHAHYRCPQCGGDGWAPSAHAGPVLCDACGAPMIGPPRPDSAFAKQESKPIWIDSQNFPRGWLGSGR